MKHKAKLLAGLCLSAALCVSFGAANWTKTAAAEESFPATWTVNENAVDLTVTDVAEGGVGTITYYTVPEGDTSEYGIYNSVTIPVSNHDVANGYVSIKFDANFDVSGHNITLYANYAAGTDDLGNDYEAGYELFGWFENWNVTNGKTTDGYAYKTIFFGNYTESKTVTGITMNFAYAGEATEAKTLRLLGMDFLAAENDVPVFATDPNDPIIEAPIAEGTVEGVTIGEWADDSAGNMQFNKDENGKTVIHFPGVPTSKSRIYAGVTGHDVAKFPKLKITYSADKAFAWYFAVNSTSSNTELSGYYENMEAGENVVLTYDLVGKSDSAPITVNKIYISIDRAGYGDYDETTYADGLGKTITLDFQFVDADGNAPSADGGIAVNGTKTVDCPVYNWNAELADTVVATITPFAGMGLEVKVGDQTAFQTTFAGTAQQIVETNLSQFDEVETVTFVLTGNGTMYFNEVILSKAASVSVYSTSNGDYFTTFEEIDEGNYQLHMVRNSTGGYPSVTATVSNWHAGYDILAIDVSVASGVTLLGVRVGDVWMLDHWDAKDFIQPGDHQFTYFNFTAGSNWDGKTITVYVNPSSIAGAGYTYESDIKLGMFFLKSADLAEGSISFAEETYTYDYDGEVKTVEATTDPVGTPVTYTFAIDGKTYDEVSDVGTYTVTATSACTRTHLPATTTTTLVINKVKAAVPQVKATADGNTVSFAPAGGIEYKMSAEDEWQPLMTMVDLAYDTEYTIILRVAESNNVFASDETTLTFRTEKEQAAVPSVTATVDGKSVTFSSTEGIEYKIGADGEWKDLATLTEFAYDTEYTLILRTKATETLLASDETTLTFKTDKDPASVEPEVPGPGTDENPEKPEKPEEEKKGGCGSTIGFASVSVLALGVAVQALFAKRKED